MRRVRLQGTCCTRLSVSVSIHVPYAHTTTFSVVEEKLLYVFPGSDHLGASQLPRCKLDHAFFEDVFHSHNLRALLFLAPHNIAAGMLLRNLA